MSLAHELPSLRTFRAELDLNVTSSLWLSSRFASVFGAHCGGHHEGDAAAGAKNVIVNVSSLAAVQPHESWGTYAAGKAARDMFHR